MPGLISGKTLRAGGSGQFIDLKNAQPQLPASPTTSTGYTLITSDKLVTTYASSLGNIQFNNGVAYSNVPDQSLNLVGTDTTSVIISGGTETTSTNTGALVVQGGVGVWGNMRVAGNASFADLTATNAAITSLIVDGTSQLQTLEATTSTIFELIVSSTETSVNVSTGALQVAGGVAVAKNLYVAQTATFVSDLAVQGNIFATGELNVTGQSGVNLNPQAASVTIQPTLGGTISIQPSATGYMNNMLIGEFNPQNAYFLNAHANNFIGLATTATNLDNGSLGSIPYQTGSGRTSFIEIGSTGTVLTSNGTTATWESSVNNSDNVYISEAPTDRSFHIILSTGTNAYAPLEESPLLSFDTNFNFLYAPYIDASASIFSQEGIPYHDRLLYTPRATLSIGTPPVGPRLGDFWIDPSQGATFQYILDGEDPIWIQFTSI
jgi:hypothetical protein